MNISKQYSNDFLTVIIWIYLEMLDMIFKINVFGISFDKAFLRICLFNLVVSILLSIILQFIPWKISRWILFVLILLLGMYCTAELEFKDYMGNYESLSMAGAMGGKVSSYALSFLKAIPLKYYAELLPALIQLVLCFVVKMEPGKPDWKELLVMVILCCAIHYGSMLLVDDRELYDDPKYIEAALNEFGINRFLLLDFADLFDEDEIVIEEESNDEVVEEPAEETKVDNTRYIDDTKWKALMEEETEEDIKTVDEYLMNRSISDTNDMTGLLEGKNFIMVMVEAFDYMAIDETLTPTLYKMMHEGWYFTNYYTPKYSCTTGESEFISEVSLVPGSDICTPNTYKDNTFSEAIFNLFENKGYYVTSYHNWEDEFYYRNDYHLNMGSEAYYDIDDMNIDLIQGWQSDKDMVEFAYPIFSDTDKPFFAYMITSSTHFPYDESSTLGDKYLDEINEIYPDMPINIKRYVSKAMELDRAMERLLEMLEEDGIADDTYIWMFADHHPLKTDTSLIAQWSLGSDIDRSEGQNIDRTPNFLYSPSLDATEYDMTACTFDLLPTIANLFGLDYDPRVYFGTDLFSNIGSTVIFPNGDWINEYGIYRASTGEFTSFEDAELSETEIENITSKVNNSFKISNLIYRTDYFKVRNFYEMEK